jgi:hypothetical protein
MSKEFRCSECGELLETEPDVMHSDSLIVHPCEVCIELMAEDEYGFFDDPIAEAAGDDCAAEEHF